MAFDKALIEAGFAMQYGIRLAKEDIAFGEFCRLLTGLTADTPLGRIVAIRGEKNPEKIKAFGEYERGVRKRWREFTVGARIARPIADRPGDMAKLQNALERAFGG
jgi:hypothetical protein